MIELDGGDRLVKINFERVIDKIKTTRVKLLNKRVDENNSDTRINWCREAEYIYAVSYTHLLHQTTVNTAFEVHFYIPK